MLYFRCSGYCTFTECSFTFSAKITQKGNKLEMLVQSEGGIQHSKDERKSRLIKGIAREQLQKELKTTLPSTLQSLHYLGLTEEQLISGNRDGVGLTLSCYKKISSEGRRKKLRDEDVCKSLMILKDEILNDSGGRMGYIQRVHAFPFSVHCYTETGVRLFHYLAKEQTLYCDATGTIVSMQNQSRALYYAIVLQHPHEGQSPVAVAEMITCEQSTTAVSYFLENFRRQEGIVFGFQNIVQPRTVVIDRSLVLLQSFLRVFNTESTTDYVNRCFRIVNGVAADEDFQKTFMYACVSHVMNSAKRMCHKLL